MKSAAATLLAVTLLQGAPIGAYTVEELVRGVSVAVGEGRSEPDKMRRAAAVLERFLDGGTIEKAATTPHPGLDVTTYALHVAPDGSFSIAVLVIRPGARTPIHDHRTWTVWGTLHGEDRETRYALHGDPASPELVPVATQTLRGTPSGGVGGAGPGRAPGPGDGVRGHRRSAAREASEHRTGPRVRLIEGPPGDIHRLENVGTAPSVSIHVHGADMTGQTRNAYDERRRTVTPFVQSYVELPGGGE